MLSCTASGVVVVSGIGAGRPGAVCAFQRGAGGIIAACVGLVFAAVERGKSQEKRLQSPVRCFVALVV